MKAMKKISIYLLSLGLAAAGMTSCGKTTNGKMSNEWKVTSMKSTETYINANGDKQIATFSVEGTVVTDSDDHYPASGPATSSSKTGTMSTNDFTIKKDGTWSWIMDATYTSNNGTSSENEKVEMAGSWSFLSKSKGDDFKKNERVLFNVLTVKARTIKTENGAVADDSSDELVYSTGKNTMIYTVKDSKKDRLELELEAENVAFQNSFQNSNTLTRTIKMESK